MVPRRFRALFVLSAMLYAYGWGPVVCRAEPEPAHYSSLVNAALQEYELGHFEEAMSLFEQAHEIAPSARTFRGMGLASFEARKYVIAVGYLRAALDDAHKPLTPQMRQEVQAALESSLRFIANFSIDLQPAGASLTVDGVPAALGASRTLSLDPGDHELVASAPGHQSATRHVSATAGRQGGVVIQLLPSGSLDAATAARTTPPTPIAERTPAGIKALALGGLSLALVGGAVGLGAGLKTLSEEDKLHGACPDKMCPQAQAGALDHAKTWGNVSTASLIVGGVGLVAGTVGLVLWARRRPRERAAAQARRWTTLPLGAALGWSGRF